VRCKEGGAAFAAFLKDELLENVGHCLWTFTLPKMLRPYFMRHRELLGDLARLGYETIKELMIEAVGNDKARARCCRGAANLWECFESTSALSLPRGIAAHLVWKKRTRSTGSQKGIVVVSNTTRPQRDLVSPVFWNAFSGHRLR
jgi:hypothetical protein